uniref:Uncharacterized protein n=1 Tax=Panagrolaimus superbus TaxID=310955 RepID=A0A914YBS7_9BILA
MKQSCEYFKIWNTGGSWLYIFCFSLLGYSVAVWHMNQNQLKLKDGSLPDDQQKLLNAYKDFKKLVNSVGSLVSTKKETIQELEEIEREISKLSNKESEKQKSNNDLETLLNEKNICQLHNLDEFNLLPEEPPMTTNVRGIMRLNHNQIHLDLKYIKI